MKFTKMHGIGNDYVYVNCFKEKVKKPEELAQMVSDRHFGIGADGLILICPSKKADVRMRIFNADGSEAEMCGNGIRCVAKYIYEHKLAKARKALAVPGQPRCGASLKIETGNGVLTVGLVTDDKSKVQQVCVNMGQPVLAAASIPVNLPVKEVIEQPMQFQNRAFVMTCVSMGNPHAVFFRKDLSTFDVEKFGPVIENHSIFPQRTNAHFVQIDNPSEFTMRTWERGSGITMACGTGACACCVAAVLTKRAERICTAHLPGGDLQLNWAEKDNCVYMTGPAVEVFEGSWSKS
ncbi:MAG: diaminopimelate epimerase [Sedimentisphaerales bacterium]|nr:diaminopimelate epimerase [Sedimentisphaerales bacterium]